MLPERRHPHAVWVRHFSRQGMCTSPSCRRSLWRCLSSPVRQNRSIHTHTHKWDVKCEIHIQTQCAYNTTGKMMKMRKTHTPLCWCSHLCWYRKGWRSTVASQWRCPSAGWTALLQSPDGETKDRMKNWKSGASLERKTRIIFEREPFKTWAIVCKNVGMRESNEPQTLWSQYVLSQTRWTGSVRRCWHLQEDGEKKTCQYAG